MTDLDKIIDRIKKLHAKSESARAIGSLHEAEAFAEAVGKMLLKYGLDMADLPGDQLDKEEPVGHDSLHAEKMLKRREPWREYLAGVTARAFGCGTVIFYGTNRMLIVGRKSERESVIWLLTVLCRTATELADDGQRRYGGDYRRSFLLGFSHRIGERFREMARAAQASSSSLVLMRVNSETLIKQHMAVTLKVESSKDKSRMNHAPKDRSGYSDGRRAGDSASLVPSGIRAGSSGRSLGSGS